MSLKAFHIIFITLSILLTVGVTIYCAVVFVGQRSWLHLALGLVSLAATWGLVQYGRYVLKKLKDISYL